MSEKEHNKILNGQDFRANDTESGAPSPLNNLSTPDLTMAHPRTPSSRTSNEEEPFPRIIGIGPTQYSCETEKDSEIKHGHLKRELSRQCPMIMNLKILTIHYLPSKATAKGVFKQSS